MKVGFYLDNSEYKAVDFSKPECGNPGIRGTQYMIWTISCSLARRYSDISICLFAPYVDSLPSDIQSVCVTNIYEAIEKANEKGLDIFVFRPWSSKGQLFDEIRKTNLKFITWCHNFESLELADAIADTQQIKRHICVGRQQYERLRDHRIFSKAGYIYNCLDFSLFEGAFISSTEKNNIVTYVGALNKLKGFHVMAKAWKKVTKEIPNAQLNVIGTGSLGNSLKVGRYGLAQEKYEKRFIKYLLDNNGQIMSNVHFLGNKGGKEKENLMRMSKVGVANPTGRGETFCIVAVEFEALGVPVVSVRKNGLLDTVENGKSGILIQNTNELADAIVYLLKNPDICDSYGKNGIRQSKEKFSIDIILQQWQQVLLDVYNDVDVDIDYEYNYPLNQAKILREWNRKLKLTKLGRRMPSLLVCETVARKLLRRDR